jgi:hypothetical protein
MCIPLKVGQYFGGTRRLHLQGHRISQAKSQLGSALYLLHICVLLDLIFGLKNEGDMLLQTIK